MTSIRKPSQSVTDVFFAYVTAGDDVHCRAIVHEYPAVLHIQNGNKLTPLHLAAKIGHTALCTALLDLGANINALGDIDTIEYIAMDYTPLHLAAHFNHPDVCSLLITRGAKVDAISVFGATPLLLACKASHAHVCSILCQAGANIRHRNNGKQAPMDTACYRGATEVCKILLRHGIDVNEKSAEGCTPLHEAIWHTHLCLFLLESGADTNLTDRRHRTPLEASQAGQHDSAPIIRAFAAKTAALVALNEIAHAPLPFTSAPNLR